MRAPGYEPEPVVVVPPGARPVSYRADGAWPTGPAPDGAGPSGSAPNGSRAGADRTAATRSGGGTTSAPTDDRPGEPSRGDRRPGHTDDEVRQRAASMVRVIVEVLAGRRAPGTLSGVARPEVVRYLAASRGAGRTSGPRRVHVSRPVPDAAEVVAVCRFGPRFRALTIRLDRIRSDPGPTWCATSVRLL